MNDEAHLAAIDAHTKGIRGHDDAPRRAHELTLNGLSLRQREPRVISGGLDAGAAETGVYIFDILSCSRIHDTERRPSGEFDDAADLFNVRRDFSHFEIQIRPIESADDLRRTFHA